MASVTVTVACCVGLFLAAGAGRAAAAAAAAPSTAPGIRTSVAASGAPRDRALSGRVYRELRGRSRLRCSAACARDAGRCRSFNYCGPAELCQLNDAAHARHGTDLAVSVGCYYYDIEIDECTSNPCQNGGNCTNQAGGYNCACPIGYIGTNCEIDVNDCAQEMCSHHGQCTDLVGGFQCVCDEAYTGVTCEIALTSCAAYVAEGLSHGKGFYMVKPGCDNTTEPQQVYCDQESGEGGWMRFFGFRGHDACDHDIPWTVGLVSCLGLDTQVTDLVVSNNWNRLDDWQWRLAEGVAWGRDAAVNATTTAVIANLANCSTPSGIPWSADYEGGFAYASANVSYLSGTHTRQNWTCDQQTPDGLPLTLRFGGKPGFPGVFVGLAEDCPGNFSWIDKVSGETEWDRVVWLRW